MRGGYHVTGRWWLLYAQPGPARRSIGRIRRIVISRTGVGVGRSQIYIRLPDRTDTLDVTQLDNLAVIFDCLSVMPRRDLALLRRLIFDSDFSPESIAAIKTVAVAAVEIHGRR